ncbi:hypothetical protein FXF51_26465 [Nonomuraea sp. PA05]|uniref:hypothetical protein n=1 Tax=Nonomuraea sp. PA05 TaxID=2604466 RepID=UPI0011D82ADC|nr:hypothetical protein [Nonomuraea sp. PA05]TYB62256.1 hypothetical protein FXF51_26465 [Nonomuraea sp. PA05]
MSEAVRPDARPQPATDAGTFPGPLELARTWPWIPAVIAAGVVNLVIGGMRQFDYAGISGFSTTNFGWMAFALVGGIVFAWRLAARPQSPVGALRPLIPAAAAFATCFVLVVLSGLIFLPGQSVLETATTDAPGRSLPIACLVLVAAIAAELVRVVLRRRGRP